MGVIGRGSVSKRFDAHMADLGWTWDEKDPALDHIMLLELVSAVEDSRAQVRHTLKAVRHDLDHLELITGATSPSLNTLGELQGKPAAVEAAVGAFAVANRLLQRFLVLYKPEGEGCAVCGEPKDGERHRDDVTRVTGIDHKWRKP